VCCSVLVVISLAAPANAATVKYSVYQKTLAVFSSTATTLTAQQKAEVRAAVLANPTAEKFICTGIRYFSQPTSVNIMVRKRAKAACDYAKQLNPNLSTWFQNKPTQARSYAGKVLLTVKSPLEPFQQVVADIRSYRTEASEQELEVFASSQVNPAVKTHYTNSVKRAAGFWSQFNDNESLVKSVNILRWDAKADLDERSRVLGVPGFGEDWWSRSADYGGGTVIRDSQGYSHAFFRLNKQGGDFPYDDYAFHEVTHSYQDGLGQITDYSSVPCWFPEGYAMVVGLANSFADDKGNLTFYESERNSRAAQVANYLRDQQGDFDKNLRDALELTHAHPQCNSLEPLYGYRLGMLVSELWIYEFGFEKTVDFMSELRGRDFATTFEEQFGTSMTEWVQDKAFPYAKNEMSR
jgi:hypothetical protein